MAVALEFIDFIVPIQVIRARYPGGWEQCLRDHAGLLGARVWYDEHLFRDGAMNPNDILELLEQWEDFGFAPTASRNGVTVWHEVCVVESLFGGPTRPCDWLEVDVGQRTAHLKGHAPGPVAGRATFREHDV